LATSTHSTHTNIYSYVYINALKHVTFTDVFSVDFLSSDDPVVGDKDLFNPKFEITWHPFPATTVHAAAFNALKRTLITNQTLEPMQVAGFNQFFEEAAEVTDRRMTFLSVPLGFQLPASSTPGLMQ
jgi:hypothetical protein